MKKRHCGQKGTAIVEAAIIMPMFVLVLIGILEFGLIFNNFLVLQTATREGARLGAIGSSEGVIEQRVRDFASNLDQGSLAVNVTNAEGVAGSTLLVNATYPVPLITIFMSEMVGQPDFLLSSDASIRLE